MPGGIADCKFGAYFGGSGDGYDGNCGTWEEGVPFHNVSTRVPQGGGMLYCPLFLSGGTAFNFDKWMLDEAAPAPNLLTGKTGIRKPMRYSYRVSMCCVCCHVSWSHLWRREAF